MESSTREKGPIAVLRRGGIANPLRVVKLIRDTIEFLKLDLSGLVVLTEAASGPFVVTPVVAAAAGAERVITGGWRSWTSRPPGISPCRT